MKNEAGTIASESVRENDAMVRNIMDIVRVMTKLNKKKVKNAPGSRRRFDMK
jgi:hypothetical protein